MTRMSNAALAPSPAPEPMAPAKPTTAPLLEGAGLTKTFGGLRAVSDVSFAVPRGTICSLIGPNGAGKTTLFNLISAVLRPTSGHVVFDGKDITKAPTYTLAKRGIARTFQNLAVFKHETVVNNLLVGMHAHLRTDPFSAAIFFGRARREEIKARERVEEIIEFLEIEDIRDLPVGTLSYGMQKRVELGRALAVNPRLLLLDEMVSGMNQEEREDIARLILDLKEELGVTVLMVEHDMGIVMDISDRVFVMNYGEKIAEGTPAEVSANPVVVDAYLGRRSAA
ncbi:ABC transporter ATP-binding protein [Rhodoligotrophos ferricapiens]|uniref:ABC transporter ATP-binding protein n=1 Tax=Rhodoligotrophos ferricapiens TaxID=3069264 RepID=UPI00315DA9AB